MLGEEATTKAIKIHRFLVLRIKQIIKKYKRKHKKKKHKTFPNGQDQRRQSKILGFSFFVVLIRN